MLELTRVNRPLEDDLSGPDDRLRQPEGRRRQDHDGRQSRRPISRSSGDRVLVVDLDPQGNATSGLGIDRASVERSIYDALVDDVAARRARSSRRRSTGLDLVPSSIALAGAEVELAPVDGTRAPPRAALAGRVATTTTTSSSTARRRSAC